MSTLAHDDPPSFHYGTVIMLERRWSVFPFSFPHDMTWSTILRVLMLTFGILL